MGLTDQWQIEQTWGSHQAVLKAVIKVLNPQTAVECGCGDFSTPHLQAVPHLLTIEHDSRWARKVCKSYPPKPGHKWTIQPFNAKNPDRIEQLPAGEYHRIRTFYNQTAEGMADFDLLFVDTFTAARVPAVLSLGHKAKWIIIHDLEWPGPEVYRWDLLDDFFKKWRIYWNRPKGVIGKGHQIPWTVLCSRDELPIDKLNQEVILDSNRLWGFPTVLELA